MTTAKPYVSIAFTNRNDNYGGDLVARINKFIEYYQQYDQRWPGLLEFVICDWNPPGDTSKLRDAFPWSRLSNVRHVEVSPEIHQRIAGEHGRKILDYIGRNVSARHASGEFVLVINQDIFVSDSIMRYIGEKRLSKQFFYRADRCDFDFEPCRYEPASRLEEIAMHNILFIHRRHSSDGREISLSVTGDSLEKEGSGLEKGDRLTTDGIIECWSIRKKYEADKAKFSENLKAQFDPEFACDESEYHHNQYYYRFQFHTNASGDFLLVPRQAFHDIHGMSEATEFYMHLDTYAVIQFFAAGYDQAIFNQPHKVFHADHDRSERLGFEEGFSWEQHEKSLSRILRNEQSFQLNNKNWGLKDYDLNIISENPSHV
jgi:hypothetical protein